ncbi:MAG TPA: transcriptional regulator GcvA [Burkholderiaceae bacterium]|nr:transcriptional regulator GcvA [Burkholderiaceae bacterium]
MPNRLPPLRALQIFEAAARHLSYSRAADELALTQSAVSHQIRGLEAWLNNRLFRRAGRSMLLTREGERLYARVHDGLACFADSVAELCADTRAGVLNISATPSISAGWLIPRLPDFYRRHPEVDINLRATNALADFDLESIDLALRYGAGIWPGLHAEKLLTVDLFPVCSPHYRNGRLPRSASELLDTTLLHYTYGTSWEEWFKSASIAPRAPLRGPRFDDYVLAVRAATGRQGILLGRDTLVADELTSGRLVRPLRDQPSLRVFDYFIVYPDALELSPKVKLFRDWLLEQAARPAK